MNTESPAIPEAPALAAAFAAPVEAPAPQPAKKELGSSEPGYVHPDPETLQLPPDSPPQHYLDRLHTLVDEAERLLPSQQAWIAREMRVILNHLGATKSE
jgi:hypothetical protein